jgi:hypothetical protein
VREDTVDGHVLRSETEVYCWDGAKARTTLAGSNLGSLVLTDRTLLFLSTGGNDVGRRIRSAAVGGTLAGELAALRTGGLDVAALDNPGSFAVPLHDIDEARASRRWDRTCYLALRLRAADGAPFECALMRKLGMPDAENWAESIDAARAAAKS